MPGMSSGLSTDNSTIGSAFGSQLVHESLFAVVILALLVLCWNLLRATQLRGAGARGSDLATTAGPQPGARRLLWTAFGLIRTLDGLLQAQPDMPLGMAFPHRVRDHAQPDLVSVRCPGPFFSGRRDGRSHRPRLCDRCHGAYPLPPQQRSDSGTQASRSSFADLLAGELRTVLGSP